MTSERANSSQPGKDALQDRGLERDPYEPPTLTDLGSFHELTQQPLKISGTSDFVNFHPASAG